MPPKRKRVEIVDENEGQKKKQKIISSNSKLYQTQIIPKNTKNNDKSTELSWSTDMPPEILFRIFSVTKFKPQDLRRAGQVCWSWNACLKDEAFGWAPFSSIHITIIWDGMMLLRAEDLLVFVHSPPRCQQEPSSTGCLHPNILPTLFWA
jgi:hypothetical protein